MNHNISKQEMQSFSSCYAEGDKTNQLSVRLKRNAFEDSVPSHSSRAIISHFLGKATKKNSLTTQDFDFSSRNLSHSTAESFQEDRSSDCFKDSVQDLGSPFSQYHISNNTEGDRLLDKHLQAKRARVENIIRGMSSSPNTILNSELERDCRQRPGILGDRYKENKRKQRLPQQQQKQKENPWKFPKLTASLKNHKRRECHKLKQQLQDMQGKLLELQEKFFHMYDASESEQEDQGDTSDYSFHLGGPDCNGENGENTLERCLSEMNQGYDCAQSFGQEKELTMPKDANKHHDVDRKFNNHTHFSFSLVKGGYLAEALKYELTNAVAHIVDSAVQLFSVKPSNISSQAFQSLPASLPKGLMPNENSNLRMASHDLHHSPDSRMIRRCYDNSQSPSIYDIQDQTEAIPLVVRKSSQNQSIIGNSNAKIPLSLALGSQMPLTELPEPLLRYDAHNDISHCLSATEKDSSSESMPPSWDAVKLRSKVISHHTAEQPFPQSGRSPAENLCLSRVKSERGELHSMEDVTPFKSVNFNRCITSQLIKWFSNFREFYYIQMEKFARQAVSDGITNANDLKVTRDTELYRALNMHYNKANDFQIPKQFLEVAEVTLREFFNAIYSGKDSDPSWKKNIYKVICKLDSEVPEIFNSQGSLQDILYN